MRSAPTSLGLSTKSGMPVRTPGSINTCGTDGQYCSSIKRTSCSTDGTVDSPAAPVSRSASSPIRPSMVSASSSEVTSDSVRIRQCCTTLAWSPLPEISPTMVCVLRTSIARSTGLPRRHQLGRIGRHICGIVTKVDLLVVGVDEHHSRLIRPSLGVLHRAVSDQDHKITRMHEMGCGAVDADHTAAALTGDRVGDQSCAVVDVDDRDLLALE